MTRTPSPRCCPNCGSVSIIRLENLDNCTRCGTQHRRMPKLGQYHDKSGPEARGYKAVASAGGGVAYMKPSNRKSD